MDNLAFEKYLVRQVLESEEERFAALREFFPNARQKDRRVEVAEQRVQIIKKERNTRRQSGSSAAQLLRAVKESFQGEVAEFRLLDGFRRKTGHQCFESVLSQVQSCPEHLDGTVGQAKESNSLWKGG